MASRRSIPVLTHASEKRRRICGTEIVGVLQIRQITNDDAVLTEDCFSLFSSFTRVRDRKARAQIIKLARQFAEFEEMSAIGSNGADLSGRDRPHLR